MFEGPPRTGRGHVHSFLVLKVLTKFSWNPVVNVVVEKIAWTTKFWQTEGRRTPNQLISPSRFHRRFICVLTIVKYIFFHNKVIYDIMYYFLIWHNGFLQGFWPYLGEVNMNTNLPLSFIFDKTNRHLYD